MKNPVGLIVALSASLIMSTFISVRGISASPSNTPLAAPAKSLTVTFKEFAWAPDRKENSLEIVETVIQANRQYDLQEFTTAKMTHSAPIAEASVHSIESQLYELILKREAHGYVKPKDCQPMIEIKLQRLREDALVCVGDASSYFEAKRIIGFK